MTGRQTWQRDSLGFLRELPRLCHPHRSRSSGRQQLGRHGFMRIFKRRQRWPQHATTTDTILFLGSVCDGARKLDHLGFSTDHVVGARSMIAAGAENWSPEQRKWATWATRYYQRQLTAAGFEVKQVLTHRRPRRCTKAELVGLQPGWHEDPYGFSALRWWNGARWTHHGSEIGRSTVRGIPR